MRGPGSAAYTVVFPRPVAELKPGAAVELAGTQIGVVRDVALEYDRNRGTLSEPVTIALEPGRLRLANEEWRPDARPQMDEMLRDLIGKGLRARIGATVPVIGGKEVELAFVPEAAPASLGGDHRRKSRTPIAARTFRTSWRRSMGSCAGSMRCLCRRSRPTSTKRRAASRL